MNNWLSFNSNPQLISSFSTQNTVILPGMPTSPLTPVTKMPQTSPPIIFLPNSAQSIF
jgi:hypothetical protein